MNKENLIEIDALKLDASTLDLLSLGRRLGLFNQNEPLESLSEKAQLILMMGREELKELHPAGLTSTVSDQDLKLLDELVVKLLVNFRNDFRRFR